VGEAVWAFKTSFDMSEADLAEENVDLVFEGLDTYSVIEIVRIAFLCIMERARLTPF
jgi:hypothetical protein